MEGTHNVKSTTHSQILTHQWLHDPRMTKKGTNLFFHEDFSIDLFNNYVSGQDLSNEAYGTKTDWQKSNPVFDFSSTE